MLEEISHRELQLIQLDILKYIHGLCELRAYLLLVWWYPIRAVRHKGFILGMTTWIFMHAKITIS